jgi:hypothetical protein
MVVPEKKETFCIMLHRPFINIVLEPFQITITWNDSQSFNELPSENEIVIEKVCSVFLGFQPFSSPGIWIQKNTIQMPNVPE